MPDRKQILLRLDPAVHDALARWAGTELRSTTAHIEYLLRQALSQAGRLPPDVGELPRRGRPPKARPPAPETAAGHADPEPVPNTEPTQAPGPVADPDAAPETTAGVADPEPTAPAPHRQPEEGP